MTSPAPVRVMIVEDSAVVRRLLSHIISRDPRLALAAAVETAEEALGQIRLVRPDVISMDIRLPGMDGLQAIERIMTERPTPIVVIADAVEDASLRISLNALKVGALSVVEKPVGLNNAGYEAIASTICTQLYIMSQVPVIRRRMAGVRTRAPYRPIPPEQPMTGPPEIMALAASTGGPPAFARILGALPADFPVPILLVQHMGAPFLQGFADWLDSLVPLTVRTARDGDTATPGCVHVAPGDRHLVLAERGVLRLSDAPPMAGQRPAADMLFSSVARMAGPRGVGVLLTGMGEDGAAGLVKMRAAGAYTVTEDESTAVVYGMPGAAVRLGASRASLPLDFIAPRLLRLALEYAD